MKRRGFLKGLGIITGGAALLPSELLSVNKGKISNEPLYDIKVTTNITESEDGWCTVSENVYELYDTEEDIEYVRVPINKNGIAYVTLPDSMKFKYVDITVMDMEHDYTRISEYYINNKPSEIMIFSRVDKNYYDTTTTKENVRKNGEF
jgi:hypothetical protein